MQVKTFEAEDMASGLKLIRAELGPDALILSTKTIRSGKLGLLGKQRLEITAAIDTPPARKDTIAAPEILRMNKRRERNTANSEKKTPQRTPYSSGINLRIDDDIEPAVYPNIQDSVSRPKNTSSSTLHYESQPSAEPVVDKVLHEEMNELKSLVKNLSRQVSRMSTARPSSTIEEEQQSPLFQSVRNSILPSRAFDDPIINHLLLRGINLETSTTIADFARESVTKDILESEDDLSRYLTTAIRPLLQVQPTDFTMNREQKRIALVGPTGVGKTTTIAKLAARFLAEHGGSIGFITIDTYRIAAVEQLKVYGDIMNLPVEVVITPQELETALSYHRDKDLILIDTAGRSPRDNYCIDELATFLLPELDIEKHLVLSATTRENELINAISQFERLGIDQTIMTKIDECQNLGVLLNIQIQNPNPLSFLTNGQRVPEDLVAAEQHTVADLIMSINKG